MKISKKEKIMIYSFFILIIGIVYYEFVYSNQALSISEKTTYKNELEQKYKNTMETINLLEDKKSEIKVLNAKVLGKSESFYPTINQEHLILELDKLVKDSGLDGGFIFNKIEVAEVPKTEKTKDDLKESTITKMTDKYNNEVNNVMENKNSSSNDNDKKSNVENSSTSNESSKNEENSQDVKKEVEQIKLELKFSGSYSSLESFLRSIRNYERKIIVNSITITQNTINEIVGTIGIEVYAIPKVNGDLEKYLKWNVNNTYGKLAPFSLDSSVGNVVANSEKSDSDFLISVKSINSELPSVIIGKSNDKSKATYIYGNNNNIEEAEIEITKKDYKYYYKYKMSNERYPSEYEGNGQEFIPSSDNINVKILSENRVNSDDKSGLKINVVNKTDKLVNVEINNDDSENSRISVSGDSKNISVTNK